MSHLLKLISNLVNKPLKTKFPYVSGINQFSSNTENDATVTEKDLKELLTSRFENAQEIVVEDVSGGCGAMFNVYVSSPEFKGLSIVKQHKTITDTLKDQIKRIHGLRIETKAV